MADESTLSIQQAERVDHQLVRGIGIPALTANIVSSTIGAGIFVIPAAVARGLGPAAPLAFLCCAIAMVLFVTCFAIAGSRVSLTGGLYALRRIPRRYALLSNRTRRGCWRCERSRQFSRARLSIPRQSRDAHHRHDRCLRFARAN